MESSTYTIYLIIAIDREQLKQCGTADDDMCVLQADNAINRPIPTLTADFRFCGIALKIASRTFVRDRTMKMIPSAKTAARAYCQLYPMPSTTV